MFSGLDGIEAMYTAYLKFKAIDELTKPAKMVRNEVIETAKTFEKVENTVAKNTSEIAKDLNKTSNAIKSINESAQKAIPPIARLKQKLAELTAESKKLTSIGKNLSMIGGSIVGATTPFIWQATEFQKGMAEVSTLVDMSFSEFTNKYKSKLLTISRQLGQDTQDVIKAFYDAISSGFAPDKALGLIAQAGKAAIAGVSDIATANDTLITVLNTWKIDLNQASDLIFKTIKYGKTTFNEIADNLGDVAPILSSVGISFNEFSAVLSVATAKGLKTGPAMTSIREAVQSLVFPSSSAQQTFKKLGLTINRETLKAKGFIGTVEEIVNAMKKQNLSIAQMDEYLSNIFGSVEAKKIVMQIMADPKAFNDIVNKFKTTNNETQKAFEKMSKSASFQLSVLKQNIKAFSISIGTVLLPPFTAILSIINKGISAINSFIEKHQILAKVLILPAVAVGGLIAIIGILISILGLLGLGVVKGITAFAGLQQEIIVLKNSLIGVISRLKAIQIQALLTNLSIKSLITGFYRLLTASISFALSPIGLMLISLSIAIYSVFNNLNVLKAGFNDVFKHLKVIYASYIEPFIKGFKIGLIHLQGAFTPIKEAIQPVVDAFKHMFNVIFKGFGQAIFSNETFKNSVEAGVLVGKVFAFIIKGALSLISPVILVISKGLSIVVNIITFFIGLIKKAYNLFNELPTPLKVVIGIALSLAIPFLNILRVAKLILIPIRLFIGLLKIAGNLTTGLKAKLILAFAVIGIAKNIWNSILGYLKNIWHSFTEFIASSWQKVLKVFLWINPITLPIMLINKLIEKLTGINLFEIGKNLILGLMNGIKAGFNQLINTIKGIGSSIVNKFKGMFGINSPSVLFKQFGNFLMQGLHIGIKEGIPVASGLFNKLKVTFNHLIPSINFPKLTKETNKEKHINVLKLHSKEKQTFKEKTLQKTGNKIINISKIIINYAANGNIKEDSKEIADEIIYKLEDFLERA